MRIKTKALFSLIISHAERIWQENVIGLIQILASVTKGSAFYLSANYMDVLVVLWNSTYSDKFFSISFIRLLEP